MRRRALIRANRKSWSVGEPHSNGRVVPSVEGLARKHVVALHPLHLIKGWQLGKVKLGDREEHLPECYTEV